MHLAAFRLTKALHQKKKKKSSCIINFNEPCALVLKQRATANRCRVIQQTKKVKNTMRAVCASLYSQYLTSVNSPVYHKNVMTADQLMPP